MAVGPPSTAPARAPRTPRGALALLLLAVPLMFACGTGEAGERQPVKSTAASVRETEDFLVDAREAASDYGMKKLGHYLKLDERKLERLGVEVPESIDVRVKTTHTGYCIIATNRDLDTSNPWAKATAGSANAASPADRCRL